jgi:hypothetical protein
MNYATLTQLAVTDPLPLTLGARIPREVATAPPASKSRPVGEYVVTEDADGRLTVTLPRVEQERREMRKRTAHAVVYGAGPRTLDQLPGRDHDDSLDANGVYEAMLKAAPMPTRPKTIIVVGRDVSWELITKHNFVPDFGCMFVPINADLTMYRCVRKPV